MKTIRELKLSNKAWSDEMRERKKDYFARQTVGQNPEIMWIGGSDSRVFPHQITQTRPGELFIHRNLANLVYPDDDNLMADLQHAVDDLQVAHIVLCGIYGCNGMGAVLNGDATGHMQSWLRAAKAVYDENRTEIDAIEDHLERINRLGELNVREQLLRLSKLDIVSAALERGQDLTLHGWMYDLSDGRLTELFEIEPVSKASGFAMPLQDVPQNGDELEAAE